MDPFELLDYKPGNFAYALQNDFNSVDSITTEKFHFRYLLDYLGDTEADALKAKDNYN